MVYIEEEMITRKRILLSNQRDDDGNDDDQSDTNDLDDSDDDLEIILDADESEQPAEGSQSNANQDAAGKNSLVNIKPNATGKVVVSTQQKQDGTSSAAKPAAGGIDLDAVGQLDGKPITDVELDSFEDKPWRKPGADITDYFNYGFNEATWRAYCNKQKILREGKGKMMGNMDMPPEMAAMGMMMPPMMDPAMGGMPPNAMMGLPMGMPMNMPPGGGNPNFRPGRPNGPPSNQGQGQGRNNNRGSMPMGRIRGSQEGGGDDKSNPSDNGDDFNPEEQHMNFPMNFPGAPPMGMFPPDMGPGGPMGGMPPFFNPNMAGPGGQMGFDGHGRGNPMMMMRGGGPMRPSRGRGSPAPGDHGSPNNDPRKRVIPPDDDSYNKRPRNR
ncbi:Fip1 motif-domain-containing protein [Umbelopsis sp. AD052]|nr:Fip1 motif-domain-containing protein [Umbelopsis sp. AD052]